MLIYLTLSGQSKGGHNTPLDHVYFPKFPSITKGASLLLETCIIGRNSLPDDSREDSMAAFLISRCCKHQRSIEVYHTLCEKKASE